jgi:hypothetical protein
MSVPAACTPHDQIRRTFPLRPPKTDPLPFEKLFLVPGEAFLQCVVPAFPLTKSHNLSGRFLDASLEAILQDRVSSTNGFVDNNSFCRQVANES